MDIKDADLNDLLSSLSGHTQPRRDNPVDIWLKEVGYYPGDTRVRGQLLLDRFRTWWAQQSNPADKYGPSPHHNVFFQHLRTKFRVGRSKYGSFYYLSKSAEPDVPKDLVNPGKGL